MILFIGGKTSMEVERDILEHLHVEEGLYSKDVNYAHAAKLDDENLYEVSIVVRQVSK